MSTNERSEALRQADLGAQAWRAAVHAQQAASPRHADFYELAAALVETLGAVESLARVLIGQVGSYADRVPDGERVYDDTRVVDPRDRLATAEDHLRAAVGRIAAVSVEVNGFWSAIGHIGVEEVTR